MNVDDVPAVGSFGDEPVAVVGEHVIVAGVRSAIVGLSGGDDTIANRLGVEDRRREMNDLRASRRRPHASAATPFLLEYFLESLFTERMVDAAVHAIASDDEVGLGGREDAVFELFMHGQPRKRAAGVTFFRQA